MRNSWSDLFVLGLAQISPQVSIPTLLSIIVSHQQTRLARENTPINVKEVTASICKIHDYVQTLAKLNISATEFAYLRSIALFGAGTVSGVPTGIFLYDNDNRDLFGLVFALITIQIVVLISISHYNDNL